MDYMDSVYQVIGHDGQDLTWWQMGIRAIVIFLFMVLVIRLGSKRIFGKHAAFDIVLGIVLGSIFSRAITGNSPFFPTMFAGLILAILHRLLGYISTQKRFGSMIKGNKQQIVRDGSFHFDTMSYASLTKEDVMEALRSQEGEEDIGKVKAAYIERSGNISFILKNERN